MLPEVCLRLPFEKFSGGYASHLGLDPGYFKEDSLDAKEACMKTIGLDIGTTTICGIMIDSTSGELLESRTRSNDSNISDTESWEKCQDPEKILAHCKSILTEFYDLSAGASGNKSDGIASIGITGQMHGILYLDSSGQPVSPLYTWQDERGNQPYSDSNTYASYLSRISGYPMATGYGLTTHFYMVQNDLVSEKAAVFCTIQDYAAMSLVHSSSPLVHSSDAASFGLFDIERNMFDQAALEQAGIDPLLLPAVTKETRIIGRTPEGIAVSAAIGDNQASFLGSVSDADTVLVNVGTGSLISVRVSGAASAEGLGARPSVDGDRLCVGSPLCGGYSYSVLKDFFARTALLFDAAPTDLYRKMDASAQELYSIKRKTHPAAGKQHPVEEYLHSAGEQLVIDTRFRGTRDNPHLRGRIENISPYNLTPGHLCLGVLKGMCDELFALYQEFPTEAPRTALIGSGNGIRKSPLLQQIFSDKFGLALKIPVCQEEAAYGAGLFSLVACGICRSIQEAQSKIKYQ